MNATTDNYYKVMTHRTEMVLGPDAMERLSRVRVIVFGVGGVGSWCAESLVRTGVRNITLVDSDIICPTNINRQIQATSSNVGMSKVREIQKRFLEINPQANIEALHATYDENTHADFNLSSYDYVIDAIDSLSSKVHLIEQCLGQGITFFSAMGAGSKIDPAHIKVEKLTNTYNCPLARVVRRRLRQKNLSTDFLCVYSDELPIDPVIETLCGTGDCACVHDRDAFCGDTGEEAVDWCGRKKRVNGALVHITAIFGFTMAGLVIRDIMKKG